MIKRLIAIAWMVLAVSACVPQSASAQCTFYRAGNGTIVDAPPAVFMFGGQSNMVGLGDTVELDTIYPWFAIEPGDFDGVAVWIDGHWEQYAPHGCYGPDLQFMRKWSKLHPGERIGVVKTAVGGTTMARWQVSGDLYQLWLNKWSDAGGLPVRGIIWMQGESDTELPLDALAYASRFSTMVSTIRGTLGAPPFIFGYTHTIAYPYFNYVVYPQMNVDGASAGVTGVYTMDIPLRDVVHFSSYGQLAFSERLYDAWAAVQ
jgi:hypothetical protein